MESQGLPGEGTLSKLKTKIKKKFNSKESKESKESQENEEDIGKR